MGYEPQHIIAPDGTPLVVITAADYERLLDAYEEAVDVAEGEATLRDIESGSGTIPSQVLFPIVEEGLSPIKAWRKFHNMSQAALARAAGISQVWVGRIETGGGYGTPKVRQALAEALGAPDWSLDLGHGSKQPQPTAIGDAAVGSSYSSKSAWIRDLLAQGLSRSEVAKQVGVRYQFVRNVDVAAQKP